HVDQIGADRQLGERTAIEHATGLARQRQKTGQQLAPGEKGIELAAARVAVDTRDGFSRPPPACERKSERLQRRGDRAAQHAETEYADAEAALVPSRARPPESRALRVGIRVELAVLAKHRVGRG